MKKVACLVTILLALSFNFTSYAQEGISDELMKLDEKFALLKEENQRQRDEILKLHNLLSPKKAEKVPVLLYHHILKKEEIKTHRWENNQSVVSEESFKEQMKYLYDNGYFIATLDELQGFLDGTKALPQKNSSHYL